MDDFEYSVEISDRDWQIFFAECEECNLLSPSLAGVDSSGMSDLDDTGSMLAKRIQKVDLTAGISDIDHPIDGPPDCEGPAVEQYLSKHGVSGMESILSGSKEDLHLQSVNIFFERLKNLTEAERLAEPSQVRAGKNRGAIEEEQQCSDGQQASCSCSTLPENTPKLNSLPARGETAVGKETMRPVNTMRNINTMKKEEPGFNISPEPAASNSAPKTNKSAYPETDLFIREEACAEARVNEVTQENQFHDPPEKVADSETTRHTDKVKKIDTCTSLDDVKQENLSRSQVTLSKRLGSHLSSNVEMLTNVKWKEEQNLNVLHSDTTSTNKTQSQESSPSASVKRKRRKKRRLSVEPVEIGHGGRTQDSEEEQYTWRGGAGLCVSEDIDLHCSHKPPNNVASSLYSATSEDMKVNGISHSVPPGHSQYQCLPENIVRQGRCQAAGSAETHASNNSQSVTPLSQIDDSVMEAPDISGNVVTHLQPCMKLQDELTGLNKYCWLPHSLAAGVTDKSDLARQSRNSERKDTRADSLQPFNKGNHSYIACENEQNLKCCTAEVKSVTLSIFPSADSNDPAVEVSQNDKLSAAKSVLAVEGGNSGTDNHTLCQRDTEDQQQLESDTDQYSPAPGKTRFPQSATGMISAGGHNIKPQQFTTRACPSSDEMSSKATSAKLADDLINSSPNKSFLSNSPSTSDMKNPVQQIEHPLEVQNLCKSDILSENNTTSQTAQLESTQMMVFHSRNHCPSGEITVTGSRQRENNLSISKDLLTGPSDIMPESSCCTLDTESVTGMSENCSSTSQNELSGQGEEQTLILEEHMEGNTTFACKIETISSDTIDPKCDLSGEKEEEVVTESKAEPRDALDSQHLVFSMSSFWSEMEKLTINDILGLRMIDEAAPPSSLPPLPENEETDTFVTTDSDFFTQLDESRSEQTKEYMLSLPDSDTALDSSSKNVLWESEPVPVSLGAGLYPDNMLLTSGSDVSQPVLSESAQNCLRKISKNISVHNLHALESESFSSTRKHPTLPTLDEGEFENLETFTDEHLPGEEKDTNSLPSPLAGSYSTSLMDIFQYFFSGKQSVPSQTATDNTTTYSSGGTSLPETYDHFFSGFDTESFFCPLFTTEDQTIDELVPIFSCSHSANRTLQFPEAYDYFFASSSSDNSSVESDEEDSGAPMRVVTRFSNEASAPQMSVDVYENFYTDNDLRQNFFWKETFSFRNINFTGSIFQKQTFSNSLSLVPVRQSDRSLRRTVCPSNVLGNQDTLLPDPLLYHLEDRIARQLAQQPFRNEDFQTAVSSPRLDAPFLPLKQSDMCLVCIAFASWVLKTANPQVGDAWKAVLLANVSALSAIRYLRKYSNTEAAPSEKKLHNALTSESFSQ